MELHSVPEIKPELISAQALSVFGDEFRSVVSELYEPADCGEFIDELLLSDWPGILGRRFQKKTSEHRRSFLIAILKAGIAEKELHTEGLDYSGFFHPRSAKYKRAPQTPNSYQYQYRLARPATTFHSGLGYLAST
jgi:hypothetical protein